MKGRPFSKSAEIGALILTLYPPPSRVTVPAVTQALGHAHHTAARRALRWLAKQGRARLTTETEQTDAAHRAAVWETL